MPTFIRVFEEQDGGLGRSDYFRLPQSATLVVGETRIADCGSTTRIMGNNNYHAPEDEVLLTGREAEVCPNGNRGFPIIHVYCGDEAPC